MEISYEGLINVRQNLMAASQGFLTRCYPRGLDIFEASDIKAAISPLAAFLGEPVQLVVESDYFYGRVYETCVPLTAVTRPILSQAFAQTEDEASFANEGRPGAVWLPIFTPDARLKSEPKPGLILPLGDVELMCYGHDGPGLWFFEPLADQPEPSVQDRIKSLFRKTGGHLSSLKERTDLMLPMKEIGYRIALGGGVSAFALHKDKILAPAQRPLDEPSRTSFVGCSARWLMAKWP